MDGSERGLVAGAIDRVSYHNSHYLPSPEFLSVVHRLRRSAPKMTASATTLRSFSFIFCTAQTRKTPTAKRPPKPTKTLSPNPQISTATTTTSISTSSLPLKKVLVPIGYGSEEMEAVILVDVLRRAGANVTLASVESQLEVEASCGTKLVADSPISDCLDEIFDLIALPGGMPGSARLRDCKILQEITSKQAEGERLYGAISSAPAVTLLPWGLLKRKQTTGHPAFMDKLPTFWSVKTNLQVSKELTTSRGPGTAFEFSISLVNQLFGEAIAKDVAELLLMKATDKNPRKEEYNEVEWSFDHIPSVLVPVANGCEEIEVVSIIDILQRAKMNVMVASVEKSVHILASQGTKIVADKLISRATDSLYDMIILPGGSKGVERLQKSRVLKKLLKEQESGGRMYGAICSSPLILHRQGLLKDKRVTAHPSIINELSEQIIDGSRVVIDGKLITSRGMASSIDFALAVVSKFFGDARARSVAEGLVFEYPRK